MARFRIQTRPRRTKRTRRRVVRRRKVYNRKSTPRRSSMVTLYPKNNSMIADRVFAKLIYCDQFTLQSTGGGITTQKFWVNGLTDPDISGTGHKPRFFNQLATLYDRYRVYGCRVEVNAICKTAGERGVIVLTANPNDPDCVTPPTSINGAMERGMPYRIVTDKRTSKLKQYFDVSKVWGVQRSRVRDDDVFSASSTGNPSWQTFFQLQYETLSAFASTDMECTVKITYYTSFYSPKYIGSS